MLAGVSAPSPPSLASLLERYAAGQYKPATFLERGVALPFTTPLLLGGRIRPAERGGAELVLANPAGTEGVYVVPWSTLQDICAPSLHDRALWARISALPMLAPRTVREAARAVAAEGFAGRPAARAAAEAAEAGHRGRALMHHHLLLELVRQGEARDVEPAAAPPPEADSSAGLQRRARAVLERLHRSGRIAPAVAEDALEGLAAAFEVCGPPRDPAGAPLPALLAALGVMARELAEAAAVAAGPDQRLCLRLLAQGAELALRCGRLALAAAHALLDDLWALLHRWHLAAEEVLSIAARPEWLLDGWDLIVGLWREAGPAGREAAALEMAALVPVMPTEARDWLGLDVPEEMEACRSGLRHWRRMVRPNQDWMTGRMVDVAFRNERLRALCA